MASQQHILAIDQSTSGSKAVVFDASGRIIAKAVAPLASGYPRAGYVEQHPEEILRSVLEALRACMRAYGEKGFDSRSIAVCGITNQRETFVIFDKTGKPLANAVVWQCKRSVDICNRYKGTPVEQQVRDRTGLIVDPYFSGTKAVWLHENDETVRSAIDAGTALFGTVDTWLLYRLTHGASYRTDYTNACRTLLFNLDKLAWDTELPDAFGLRNLQLPEVHGSSFDFGTTDFNGILSTPVRIGAMIGDSHASAFSQACCKPGTVKTTMGTGSSILMNVGSTRRNSTQGMMATICWSTVGRVDYALEGIIVSCGATLSWIKDQLKLIKDYNELEPAARRLSSNDGVYLVPAFAGLGAPHWKMEARGAISGLTFATTSDHLLRAALESVAYQIRDVIGAMERDAGLKVSTLAADGGISKDAFVMQFCADLLDTQVVRRGIEEGSALGAACLAAIQAGIFRDVDDAVASLELHPQVYTPGTDRRYALEGHTGWLNAVGKV